MAQQRNTISIFSAVLAISAVNAKCGLIRPKSGDHFDVIMQNKANFLKGQRNISIFTTKDYENQPIWGLRENKANQSQNAGLWPEARSTKPEILNRLAASTTFRDSPEPRGRGGGIKHNYLPVALFPLTSSTARDYNEIFCLMSCLERTPSERVWK